MVHDKAGPGGRTARRSKTHALLSLACAAALAAAAGTHGAIAQPAPRALPAPVPLGAEQTPPEGWLLWPAIGQDARGTDLAVPVR